MVKNFYEDITTVLRSKGVEESDIRYITNLISESRKDANMLIMADDTFDKLADKGLDKVFEEACKELNISWDYSNEPLE